MNDALIREYRKERMKRPFDTARQCLMGARHTLDPKRRRYFTKEWTKARTIPGIGTVSFDTKDDETNDDGGCGVTFSHIDSVHKGATPGTRVGNAYYTGYHRGWDGPLMVTFDYDVADTRKYYLAQGCSKSDAEVLARASIKRQCQYYGRKDDRQYIGLIVKLTLEDGTEEQDSLWGIEYETGDGDLSDYILDTANEMAEGLCSDAYERMAKESLDERIDRRYHDAINLVPEAA